PLASANAQTTNEYVPGEIIVKLRSKSSKLNAQAFVGKSVSERGMSLKGSWTGLRMHHFALKAGESVEAAIAELEQDPEVQYAEPNYIVHRQSTGVVEGQPISMAAAQEQAQAQAQSSGSNSSYSYYNAQTSAPIQDAEAWSSASSSSSLGPVVVAIVDTGVDYNHSVFQNSGAIWTNPGEIPGNGIDDDHNGYIDDVRGWNFVNNTNAPMDDDGHGTHVAGIVLGTTQDITANPIGQAKIRIMPLKFLDSKGSGTTSDAVKAIYYAVNNGAKVINNSWGGGSFSNSLIDAIAYAYDKKVSFVAAAGNAANNNDASPTYPANYSVPNMISVAATTDMDYFTDFSNYGAQSVHVASPGKSIWSTLPNNTFGRISGTSMAAPFVSGMAALMMRESPSMSGYQVKNLIFSTGNTLSSLQNKTSTRNRINVLNALSASKNAVVAQSQPSYDVAAARAPASEVTESVPACGLVAKAVYDAKDGNGPQGPHRMLAFFTLLLVLASPIIVSFALRNREGKNKRQHTRYQISSAVTLKLGDRELTGQVSSISMGGLQVNTDAWLDNGGIVKMSIQSPDGKEEIAVEGRVVWSEANKAYGVAFNNADSSIRSQIQKWTSGLLRGA
ncbi:MAG: serine protease, partial [Proteobacteria bacterium]